MELAFPMIRKSYNIQINVLGGICWCPWSACCLVSQVSISYVLKSSLGLSDCVVNMGQNICIFVVLCLDVFHVSFLHVYLQLLQNDIKSEDKGGLGPDKVLGLHSFQTSTLHITRASQSSASLGQRLVYSARRPEVELDEDWPVASHFQLTLFLFQGSIPR